MANNKIQDSIFKIAGNFAVNAGAPFDSRTLVDDVEDLTKESTWYQKKDNPSDADKKILLYNGLTVTIANTVSALYSAGIAAVAMAKEGATLAEILNTGMTSSNTAVKIIATAAHYGLATAQGVVTAAQWLLNAAMEANPIGLVIIAVMALVAAL